MDASYTFRTAQGVWINDMRNQALPHHQWPSVVLDAQAMKDLGASIRLQAESGFNSVTLFGLLTASDWLPDLPKTVSRQRQRQVRRVAEEVKACGMKLLYGLGVYSWGFDRIIEADPAVRGPNPHAMCASQGESQVWMEKVVDYLLAEFHFDGFHLEASDLGRCTCPRCAPQGNTEYYSRLNALTARYIRQRQSDALLMVNMCGYLPWGTSSPRAEWPHLLALGKELDFLIDAGHAGYFIDPAERAAFIRQLPCAFGSAGGVWVYQPQRWRRRRWFLPYTQRSGAHLAELHVEGGQAVEYYMGPSLNPGVEANIAFGGRKLNKVRRDNRALLAEVLEKLYHTRDVRATERLTDLFIEAEEAFFASFDPPPAQGGQAARRDPPLPTLWPAPRPAQLPARLHDPQGAKGVRPPAPGASQGPGPPRSAPARPGAGGADRGLHPGDPGRPGAPHLMDRSARDLMLGDFAFKPPERIPRFDNFWEYPASWEERLGQAAQARGRLDLRGGPLGLHGPPPAGRLFRRDPRSPHHPWRRH
ncbi:MAG: hypothetical protein FJY95_16450 [Candidatus Handelsmanbacteria bacterium]|nr:hypothetical protein [Candidatus Handelsmanbacteria bacterium]